MCLRTVGDEETSGRSGCLHAIVLETDGHGLQRNDLQAVVLRFLRCVAEGISAAVGILQQRFIERDADTVSLHSIYSDAQNGAVVHHRQRLDGIRPAALQAVGIDADLRIAAQQGRAVHRQRIVRQDAALGLVPAGIPVRGLVLMCASVPVARLLVGVGIFTVCFGSDLHTQLVNRQCRDGSCLVCRPARHQHGNGQEGKITMFHSL